MNTSLKYLMCILWIICLYVCGILIFTKGFLLKRIVIEKNSSCDVDFTSKNTFHGGQGCWSHRRYKRAVIVIIDALRYDFAKHQPQSGFDIPYRNKLTVFHELTSRQPQNAILYRFIADPPTTTLQRLKGLTTGSLPTFVDAGSNFAKTEIVEDNFIDQLKRQGKKITFLGDDTWEGLFPQRFDRSFPFSSFNVKDLHTVDNGIIKDLTPELKKRDWDVLIAHFLGVDHCGHTFGPNNTAMAEKLTQMNKVIRSVVRRLDEETVLFVFGDHGMTRSGDHGGDSDAELEAALFVYSPSQITSSDMPKGDDSRVSQVDFVPTISLLLGLPVPFSNLGSVMVDLFNHCPWWQTSNNKVKQVFHTVEALRLNAHQVHNYLQEYSKVSQDFPHHQLKESDILFSRLERDVQNLVTDIYMNKNEKGALEKFTNIQEGYMNYLQDVKEMSKNVWAKFDQGAMLIGISFVLLATILAICLHISNRDINVNIVLIGSLWAAVLLIFIHGTVSKETSIILAIAFGFCIIGAVLLSLMKLFQEDKKSPKGILHMWKSLILGQSLESVFGIFGMCAYSLSMFSNSFVVFEDTVSTFLCQSILAVAVYKVISYLSTVKKSRSAVETKKFQTWKRIDLSILTSPELVLCLLFSVGLLVMRASVLFRACREEQWQCEDSLGFLQSLSSLSESSPRFKNIRYFLSVSSSLIISVGFYYWMRYFGNLNGHRPSVLCARYLPLSSSVALCFYWALQGLPPRLLDALPPWQVTTLPRFVYLAAFICVVSLLVNPLCILQLTHPHSEEVVPFLTDQSEGIVPRMYTHLKTNWRKHFHSHSVHQNLNREGGHPSSRENTPVVYGLATVYSSAVLLFVVMVTIVMSMLLGDGNAPGMLLLMLSLLIGLEIHGCNVRLKRQELSLPVPSFSVKWWSIFMWGTMASHFFFATGHQATIPNIRFESAYHGFHGDFNIYAIPAVLISMNTFASQIIFTLALPLLILWPLSHGELLNAFQKRESLGQGEFVLNEYSHGFKTVLYKVTLGNILFYGIKVLSSMTTAAVLKRHLMVWKIFAPKFIFESAGFLVVCITSILMYLFVLRIHNSLEKWIKQLGNKIS